MSKKPERWRQYYAAFTISIGAWGYGTVLGWPSNITNNLRAGELNGVKMTDTQLSWAGSVPTLGAMFSCLVIGFIADAIGRKTACFITLGPSILGWILILSAQNVEMVYSGRFLTGLGGGGFVVVAPVYTTEISETIIRGTCGLILQILLIFGVFYSNVMGWIFSVFFFNFSCLLVPILFGVLFIFQPETPFYYLEKGKKEEAEDSLRRLRGKDYDITEEINYIIHLIEFRPERSFKTFVAAIRTKAQIKATIICFMLMWYQKYSGVNVIVFYTKDVFIASGIRMKEELGVILTGGVGVLGTFVCVAAVDYFGRIALFVTSTFLCMTSTFCIGLFFHLKETWSMEDLNKVEFLPALGMILFLFSFNLGIGSIPWLSCSELWAPSIKAKLGSVACAFNWSQAFVVSRYYFAVSSAIGIANTFYIFTLISCSSIFFVIFFIPETKNKRYDEILPGLEKFCTYC